MRYEFTQMIAGFAGILDTSFMMPIIALYAMSLGASAPQAGIIAALYSIAAIPFSIIAGILVDRLGRKKTLTFGLGWDALIVFLYGHVSSYHYLAVLRVLHAFGGSFVFPALFTMARESDGKSKGGIVKVLASMALAIAIGSASGGILASKLGYRVSFMLLAFIIGISALLSITLPETLGKKVSEQGIKSWKVLREFKYTVFAGLWLIFSLYVALGIMIGGLAPALVGGGVLEERSARLVVGIGLGLSSLVASVFFSLHGALIPKIGLLKVVVYSAMLSFLIFISGTLVLTPTTLILVLGAFGVALAGFMLVSTILVTEVPPEVRGTSVGLQQVFNIVGVSIGAPVGGLVALVGVKPVLLLTGFVLILGGMGMSLIARK
ncbi:MFS transporter [Thermococcus sp. MV5]|uniref:MFS transporter n=1 Tax=Thermococcus sp. MV5 TaxID=1638272 RepID=UPI001F0F7D89|nr:MFS transporter [Thermococcus sp. MV5]